MTDRRTDPDRPTGDEMLARLEDERTDARGRLRIYLGMAPGVGKTYRMLEEAHRRSDRGTDVAVGFVECHGRPRTLALLDGLEILPRLKVPYGGVVVEEMDADAVIARKPTVAIVDELAHTNAPGSPREKRWQDVELIRGAGIHVISTCNVQHIESVADAVETIVGAPVRERLPDAIFASADEVELVDMSPHALRQRIRHGNVYPPDRARLALDRFFTEPNLTALRELSLRFVTRRVDDQLEGIMGTYGRDRIRPVTERVLVAVDERPESRRALRRGGMIAAALDVPLLAVVIDTPEVARLSFDRSRDLQENLDYADDLGAEVVRREAADLVTGLVQVARDRRVTHVVLAHEERRGRLRLFAKSPAEAIIEQLPEIEVHLTGPGRPDAETGTHVET
jgi:two-component system, OmpR family, sensor histidine kinase KdpD